MDRRHPDECWDWTAKSSFEEGYGAIGYRGKQLKAHRVAWELTNGPIPDGLWVLHKCDRPQCCNPHHLYLGTASDNTRDMVSRDRVCRTSGEERWVSKLTESQVREIRRRYAAGGVTQKELADEFGVTFQNISWVVLRKSWKHLP